MKEEKLVYYAYNKPVGVTTIGKQPGEEEIKAITQFPIKVFPVGRLDKDSEGLLLLTDDGDLAYKLTHPKFGIDKVYVVTLAHDVANKDDIKKSIEMLKNSFLDGVDIGLGDGIVKAKRFKHLRGRTFEIVLEEGKKRQIRRMFRRLGFHIARLQRVRIGTITIGGVKKGEWKYLSKEEVTKLKSI